MIITLVAEPFLIYFNLLEVVKINSNKSLYKFSITFEHYNNEKIKFSLPSEYKFYLYTSELNRLILVLSHKMEELILQNDEQEVDISFDKNCFVNSEYDIEIRVDSGEYYPTENERQQAEKAHDDALFNSYLLRAEALTVNGQYPQAETVYQELCDVFPNNPEAHFGHAKFLQEIVVKYHAAEAAYRRALALLMVGQSPALLAMSCTQNNLATLLHRRRSHCTEMHWRYVKS